MAASINNDMALDKTLGKVEGKELVRDPIALKMNISNAQKHPFDFYAGCATGYLKGCFISARSHHNLNELESLQSRSEIKCMSWNNYNEEEILTGQRDNIIIHYSLVNNKSAIVPMDLPVEPGLIRNLKSHDHLIFAAFSKGLIKCQVVQTEGEAVSKDEGTFKNIDAGPDIFCMDHNRYKPSMILSGGKENPLKLWDISKPNTPVFTSKNVKNDWLNLTVPIWDTQAKFGLLSDKIVTGTANAHIRLYDPSSTQRRPVIDVDTKEKSPVTSLAVRPSSENQVVVGTGKGSLLLVDLRKNSVVRNYKGLKGGVTDIQFHPSKPFFGASSIDRHIYCFDPDAPKQAKCSSIYAVSQINCILFSSSWTPNDEAVQDNTKSSASSEDKVQESCVSAGSDYDEEKELWESMSVVKTKRKSSLESESVKRSKRRK